MILTEQQLFDYIICPALYDIKYNKKIPISEQVSMPKLLKKVSQFFYLSLLSGKVPSSNELKKKWDNVCEQNNKYIDAKKNIEGIGFIMKLLQWAAAEQIIVADIDTKYRMVFKSQKDDNFFIELIGSIGTVLSLGNDKFELLITDFSTKLPDQAILDMKLKYSLDCYIFNNLYNKKVSGVRVRNIKNAKDYFSARNEFDYNRLTRTIINIGLCINQKLYYPRESIMCSNCNAKDYCKVWD